MGFSYPIGTVPAIDLKVYLDKIGEFSKQKNHIIMVCNEYPYSDLLIEIIVFSNNSINKGS